MTAALYVPLICAAALSGVAPTVARRAAPAAGAALLVAAMVVVAVGADVALGVLVGARLLDAAPLAALLSWRAERPGHIPVPVPMSLAAALAMGVVAVAAWRDWRATRAVTEALRAIDAELPSGDLVILRSADAIAFAVAGPRTRDDRIVVSEAMLAVLSAGERRVLLAHERSHLRHHHDRYRRLATVAARINPLVRPGVSATDLLLERWADEDAASAVGSRRLVARAVARAALAAATSRAAERPTGFAAAHVTHRVAALLSDDDRPTWRPLLLPVALALAAATAAAAGAHELAHLFDLLRGDG